MSLSTILNALSQVDATLSVCVAAVFVALTQGIGQRRALTRRRLMEAALSAILLWVLCVRYAITALAVVVDPVALLGPDVPSWGIGIFSAAAVVLAFIGWVTHRGSVGVRVSGTVVLAIAAVAEALLGLFAFSISTLARVDNGVGVLVAAAALVLAAFHWSHRTATPDPLGSNTRPLDY